MKVEFRKVPTSPQEYNASVDSVEFKGTFCRISSTLIEVDATISGDVELQCCRCGESQEVTLDHPVHFLLSNGIYNKDRDDDELIIEVENNTIDFDELIESELSSIQSDYFTCDVCASDDSSFEQEF